jgi:hypothetical protein
MESFFNKIAEMSWLCAPSTHGILGDELPKIEQELCHMGIDWALFRDNLSTDELLINTLDSFEGRLMRDPQIINLLKRGLYHVSQQDEAGALTCIEAAQALLGPSDEVSQLYPIYFFAAALPETLRLFQAKSVSEDIIKDTLMDFQRWLDVYRTGHNGSYGFNRQHWLLHHFCCHLVQLGRLQFQIGEFGFPFTFYFSKINDTWCCVASAGLKIDETGHVAGTNGVVSKTWITQNTISDGFLTVHAVDLATGTVLPDPITLDLRKIQILVQPNAPVLHIHIPTGGTLDDSMVSESFNQARRFFDSWDVQQDIMVCDSWLLDPALAEFLLEDGNICKFMRRFAKFPVFRDRPQIYERVFGASFDPSMLSVWPCTTSLQRSLRDFLLGGGKVYTTAGLLIS